MRIKAVFAFSLSSNLVLGSLEDLGKNITLPIFQLGENAADTLYRLPDGTKWNGKGSFTLAHFLHTTPEHEAECIVDGAEKRCIQELSRSLHVEKTAFEFASVCLYEDCFNDIPIPAGNGLLVDLHGVTEIPLLSTNRAPFRPIGECKASTINMYVPGRRHRKVKHYRIYLLVKLRRTFFSDDKLIHEREVELKAHTVLEDGSCNSIMSHRL